MGCKTGIVSKQENIKFPPLVNAALDSLKDPFAYLQHTNSRRQPVVEKTRKKWIKLQYPDLVYQGEMDNLVPNGKGRLYNTKTGQLYYGFFNYGQLIKQKCVRISPNGFYYIGPLSDDNKFHGQGLLRNAKYEYKGQFNNGNITGYGSMKKTKQKIQQHGIFQNGKIVKGIQFLPNGVYQGEFDDGKKSGKGIFLWNQGGKYAGEFQNDMKHGKGIVYDIEGKRVKICQWFEDRAIQ